MRVTFRDVNWRRDIGESKAGLDWTGSDDILFNLYLMEHELGAISRPHTR